MYLFHSTMKSLFIDKSKLLELLLWKSILCYEVIVSVYKINCLWNLMMFRNIWLLQLYYSAGDYSQPTNQRGLEASFSIFASKGYIFKQHLHQLYKLITLICCPYLSLVVSTRANKSTLNLGELKPLYPNSCQIPNIHLNFSN